MTQLDDDVIVGFSDGLHNWVDEGLGHIIRPRSWLLLVVFVIFLGTVADRPKRSVGLPHEAVNKKGSVRSMGRIIISFKSINKYQSWIWTTSETTSSTS